MVASLRSDHSAVLARLDAINAQSKVFDAMIAAAEVKVSEAKLALARTEIVSPVRWGCVRIEGGTRAEETAAHGRPRFGNDRSVVRDR